MAARQFLKKRLAPRFTPPVESESTAEADLMEWTKGMKGMLMIFRRSSTATTRAIEDKARARLWKLDWLPFLGAFSPFSGLETLIGWSIKGRLKMYFGEIV
jgi:hypothetical protein